MVLQQRTVKEGAKTKKREREKGRDEGRKKREPSSVRKGESEI